MLFNFLNLSPHSCFVSEDIRGFICLGSTEGKLRCIRERCFLVLCSKVRQQRLLRVVQNTKQAKKKRITKRKTCTVRFCPSESCRHHVFGNLPTWSMDSTGNSLHYCQLSQAYRTTESVAQFFTLYDNFYDSLWQFLDFSNNSNHTVYWVKNKIQQVCCKRKRINSGFVCSAITTPILIIFLSHTLNWVN